MFAAIGFITILQCGTEQMWSIPIPEARENAQGLPVSKHLLFKGEESFGCTVLQSSLSRPTDAEPSFLLPTRVYMCSRTTNILFRSTSVHPKDIFGILASSMVRGIIHTCCFLHFLTSVREKRRAKKKSTQCTFCYFLCFKVTRQQMMSIKHKNRYFH